MLPSEGERTVALRDGSRVSFKGGLMMVRFFDRQELSNPVNGTNISTKADLLAELNSLSYRKPFFCELAEENSYNLLIGLGGAVGCVQYSAADGSTPYLMAVGPDGFEQEGFEEFLIDDTATPVARRYCMSFDLVKEVAVYFLETGDRNPLVTWEEI